MQAAADLVIRGGTVFDGGGGDPFVADIAITDGKIVAVGAAPERGREEIDARGKIVTPGFIDVHTHYDGQLIWSNQLSPSSSHGVTTVVTGNCGVGFAPCRPEDHTRLIKLLEGVEDMPEVGSRGWPDLGLDKLSRLRGSVEAASARYRLRRSTAALRRSGCT